MLLRAALAWQSRMVLYRHLCVYLRNWYTAFLPPATEPIILLLAFGLGLGGHVAGLEVHGTQVSYADYIAPGILAYTAFLTPFFQSLYGAFIRMHYQKTWEGQLTTQILLPHVVWGEVLWAALLGATYVAIVAIVLVICQLCSIVSITLAYLPFACFLAFIGGIAFASLGLLFTAWLPTIDHMTLPIFLLALPLGFTSNTYFPMPTEHSVVAALMHINPLYHLAEILRSLLLDGTPWLHLGSFIALCILITGVCLPLAHRRLRQRVLGERT